MSHVFEVVLKGVELGVILNNIFHVFDGNESESPDDVADVFEDNYLVDIKVHMVNNLTWNEIVVTPMDVSNPADPIVRGINLVGENVQDALPTGTHAWVKLLSDDNGFKSGGKMIPGLSEVNQLDGLLEVAYLDNIQTVFDDLITDLVAAGLALCIYRPSLSSPGFPQVSTSSSALVRGIASNNRRQKEFQQ